jgi:hypothetical protein
MKSTFRLAALFTALLIASSTTTAQTSNPAKLRFRGIGLDSTYAQVIKALGKPTKNGPSTEEGCIGGQEKELEFEGVSFYLMNGDSKGGKTFEVKSFEIKSPKYVTSGVKVGDRPARVRKTFGRKYSTDRDPDTGETIWHYAMNDREGPGTTTFRFKNGKITSIASDFLVC